MRESLIEKTTVGIASNNGKNQDELVFPERHIEYNRDDNKSVYSINDDSASMKSGFSKNTSVYTKTTSASLAITDISYGDYIKKEKVFHTLFNNE